MMSLIITSIFVFICFSTDLALGRLEELDPVVPMMSENLYLDVFKDKNSSLLMDGKGYQPLNLQDIQVSRRWNLWLLQWFLPGEHFTYHANDNMCHMIGVVHRGALHYIHRYYTIRTTYVDTKEYELGYLSHQIVHKYSLMLETYQIIIRRFVEQPDVKLMPTQAMFYFYTNMLEQAQIITNLVGMVNELEAKYKGITNNLWDDPTTRSRRKRTLSYESNENETTTTTTTTTTEAYIEQMDIAAMYEKKRKQAIKQRKRELRKKRQEFLKKKYATLTTPTYTWTRQKKSSDLEHPDSTWLNFALY